MRFDDMKRLIGDQLVRPGILNDSQGGYFSKELLRVRSRMYEMQMPELKALSFLPIAEDLTPTDESYTADIVESYGVAAPSAGGYSSDAPRADVTFRRGTPQGIAPIQLQYGYNFHEMRVASALNRPLSMQKAKACRRGIEEKLDAVLAYGSAAGVLGPAMTGLANVSGANNAAVTADGTGSSKTWASKTIDQILRDIRVFLQGVKTATNNVEYYDTIILPDDLMLTLQASRIPDTSDVFMTLINKAFPEITFKSWDKLNSVPNVAGSGRRAIGYRKSDEVLAALVIPFEQQAPFTNQVETVVHCSARIGGIWVARPKAIGYMDEI